MLVVTIITARPLFFTDCTPSKTHNVALAQPVANYVVSLGADGSVQAQGVDIDSAVTNNRELASLMVEDRQMTDIAKQELPELAHKVAPLDGKLIMKEEVAEGQITWKSLKLILSALGGNHPALFFTVWLSTLSLAELSHTLSVWFLGHWGSQYEVSRPSEVNELL